MNTPTLLNVFILCCALLVAAPAAEPTGKAWSLHVIDNTSAGADGIKLRDANGDGREDIITGWEEGGVVRLYTQPAIKDIHKPWPMEFIGAAKDVEDAVMADLDDDGQVEVIACSEGKTREVRLFRRQESGWQAQVLPALNKRQWMFAWPLDVDGKHGVDLVVGGKNKQASIGWLEAPADPFDAASWTYHSLSPVGWIMSIWFRDIDGDGDQDIIYTDRRGKRQGYGGWSDLKMCTKHGPSILFGPTRMI